MRFPVQTPNTTRRCFMLQAVTAAGAALVVTEASAQAMVDEKDGQAAALGYKADSSKVDGKKYAAHKAEQNCGNCALFQGKAGDKAGGCPLFAGKNVAAAGWCSAYAKKG